LVDHEGHHQAYLQSAEEVVLVVTTVERDVEEETVQLETGGMDDEGDGMEDEEELSLEHVALPAVKAVIAEGKTLVQSVS